MAGPCHVPMRSAVGAGPIIHANAMTKCVRRLYRYLMAGKRLQGGHQDILHTPLLYRGFEGEDGDGFVETRRGSFWGWRGRLFSERSRRQSNSPMPTVNTPPPERRWLQSTAESRIGPPFGGLRSHESRHLARAQFAN
jgi:hypothetical protein